MQAKVRVNMGGGRVWLEVDSAGVKDAMRALSAYGEVFSEPNCGQCGSDRLAYDHREHDGHDYYSLKCLSCGSQLDFGQHKNGQTLFAKRKLSSGEYDKEHRGWYRWSDRKGGERDAF